MTTLVVTALPLQKWWKVPSFIFSKNRKVIHKLIETPGFVRASEVICIGKDGKPIAFTVSEWRDQTSAHSFAHGYEHSQLMNEYSNSGASHDYDTNWQEKELPSIEEGAQMLTEARQKKDLLPIELRKKFRYGIGIKIVPKNEQLAFFLSKEGKWLSYRLIGLTSKNF